MQSVMIRGRDVTVERKRRSYSPCAAAEAMFKGRAEALFGKAANGNSTPRILEDVTDREVPVATPIAAPREETEHGKVFRLVGEKKFEEAARVAKRLIDAGNVEGFFIYGGTSSYRRALDTYRSNVATSRRGVAMNVQSVGPEMAQAILQENSGNRKIHAMGLAARMRDIAAHAWELNGQAVIIAKTGELNDGQHRLWSILLTGETARLPIVYGVARETRRSLDQGKVRGTRDRFGFADIPNGSRAASVVNLAFRIIEGREGTESEKMTFYEANADHVQKAVNYGNGLPKSSPVASVSVAGFFLLHSGHKHEDVARFFKTVRGALDPTGNGDPAFSIHKALAVKQSRLLGNNPQQQVFTIIGLYQNWLSGRRQRGGIKVLTEMPGGL